MKCCIDAIYFCARPDRLRDRRAKNEWRIHFACGAVEFRRAVGVGFRKHYKAPRHPRHQCQARGEAPDPAAE